MKRILLVLFFALKESFLFAQCGPIISTYPYSEGFETSPAWTSGGTNSDWAWGTPSHPTISSAGGGVKCWCVGGLSGSFYNYSELSWIMSPCFDFSTLNYPWISFKIFWEDEWIYDGMVLQYSLDGGITWLNVGAYGDPVDCLNDNWYDYNNIKWLTSIPIKNGWTGRIGATVGSCQGGHGSGGWVTAMHTLPYLASVSNIRFRFLFGAGTTCNSFDGIAIDDILIQDAPPIVLNFPRNYYICSEAAGSAQLTASGGTTYLWTPSTGLSNTTIPNPISTPLATTTYIVTVSNGSCSDTAHITVYLSTPPIPPTIIRQSDTLTVPQGYVNYQWYYQGSPIVGANNYYYVTTQTGLYSVYLTDTSGCQVISNGVQIILSILDIAEEEIKIYPNPMLNIFTVEFPQTGFKESQLIISDAIGKEIMRKYISEKRQIIIDASSFAKGVYFIQLNNGNIIYRTKVVKE